MGNSQHKETERLCPGCGQVGTFPDRNQTCGCKLGCDQGQKPNPQAMEEQTITPDGWNIELKKTRIKSLDELIKEYKVDLVAWEVKKFKITKWEVGAADKVDGKLRSIVVEPLFAIWAELSPRRNIFDAKAEIELLKKVAKTEARVYKPIKFEPKKSGNMLELSIPDIHMGKLAWGQETGWEDYDTRIAGKLFRQAARELVARTASYKFDEICFVIGNDLLNTDNKEQLTTRGTPQATDSRYHKVFKKTREMILETIEELRPVAPVVRAILVPGNHDALSVWHLGDSLECIFAKCPGVMVDNAPTWRKYHQWGKVMLMWTHGDKGKHEQYPLLMATEQKEMFGATEFHEAHVGHLHQVALRERMGVRVRILSTLCAADAWHADNAYVGNLRAAEAFVWNKEEGLLGTAIYAPLRHNGRAGKVA
jgi:hypothetical protein